MPHLPSDRIYVLARQDWVTRLFEYLLFPFRCFSEDWHLSICPKCGFGLVDMREMIAEYERYLEYQDHLEKMKEDNHLRRH